MTRILFVCLSAAVVVTSACSDKASGTGTAPSPTTSSVAVTLTSPLRIGESAQAAATATMSNGQTQPVTSGWQSDIPTVARVSDAGQVTGVANGRANIYVISGGQQGTLGIRVVPDYLGRWSGRLLVTTCTQSGAWAEINFCGDFPAGSSDPFGLSVNQTGESINARPNYGDAVFPSAASSIQPDGSTSFVTTFAFAEAPIFVDASWTMNGPRSGELVGTVNEVWRATGYPGEGRLSQDIVNAVRTSITPLLAAEGGGVTASGKANSLQRLFRH
jgi:hypothetical protein